MSAISDYVAAVKTAFTEIGSDVDSLSASLAGVSGDVAALKALIEKLQSNPGPITPEDQALLDESQSAVAALASRVKAVATSLKELDAATAEPPAPPA